VDGTILSDGTVVTLHPLSIARGPNGDHEIGRAETGVYISVPAEGADLISWLQAGLPLGTVRQQFANRYGEPPDIEDFITGLTACEFVQSIDGRRLTADEEAPPPTGSARRGWRLLDALPAERVAWLLSPPMRVLYWSIWLVIPAVFLLRRDLVPSASDAILHPRMTVNVVILAVVGWILVFLHELAHLLTARARGCGGSLTVSHRLYFLVAQTDLSAVRALPHNQRCAPYLAGMTWDMGVVLACTLLRMMNVLPDLAAAVAYLALVSVVFQCAFFMRTDIYLVFVNRLRLGNLMQDTRHWLVNLAHRLLRRPLPYDLSRIPSREIRIIRYYAAFYCAGVLVLLGVLLVVGVPLLMQLLRRAVTDIAQGPTHIAFWDGTALLLFVTLNVSLLIAVTWRDHRMRHPYAPPTRL
jgi:putative peptide zinc metalloprotease protein